MVDLYIAPVTEDAMETVFPPERQEQLEETVNEDHRRQRYAVWKLLEYGLLRSLGKTMEQLEFTLDQRGRWSCPTCYFSLTHSGVGVAVVISDAPVGVDMESLQRTVHPALGQKILTEAEQVEVSTLDEAGKNRYLLEKWCCKESLFKWKEAVKTNQPAEICTGRVTVAQQAYCYAVATTKKEQLRLIILEDTPWN